MRDSLILLAAILAVPLVLLVLRSAFAWRYERMLRRMMSRSLRPVRAAGRAAPALAANRPPLTFRTLSARAVPLLDEGARALQAVAVRMTRRARLAFISAALVYSATVGVTMAAAFLPTVPADARVVAVVLSQACIPFVVVAVLQLRPSRAAAILGGYGLVGAAAVLAVATADRAATLVAAEAELFLILPAIGLSLLVLRRLRPLLVALAALLLYLAVTFVVGALIAGTPALDTSQARPWMWALGILAFVAGIVVVGWLLGRRSVRRPVAVLAGLAVAGLVIELAWQPAFPIGAVLMAVPVQALQVFLVWLAFRLAVRLQDLRVVSAQVLHSHIAFGFLSLYWMLVLSSAPSLFPPRAWPQISIVVAFFSYVLVLHVTLYRLCRQRPAPAGRRLLFLRAFGETRGRERLLHALEDAWRRIGRIDLIAGTDLGVHTLGSRMVEAFIVRRPDAQFLKTEEEVARRLSRLRSGPEANGRHPVNEIYCYADTWRAVVSRLAPDADAVLMDLRGFSRRNRGCVFELTELVHRVPLRRVVLLVDRTTDAAAVEEVAQEAWADLPEGSPNAAEAQPELRLLDATGSRARMETALFALLLDAAAASAREPGRAADALPA